MRLRQQMERTLGRLAIPHLTWYLIFGQVLAFVLRYSHPGIVQGLMLVPAQVWAGQWWRLLSFLFIPMSLQPLWLLFDLYFFWMIGTALENTWGPRRYNLFLLVGYLATVAASFIVPQGVAGNGFLYGSTFLAFAFLYPDFVIYLFLILPVKVKYLAWVAWAIYALSFLSGDWMTRVMVLAAVLNFVVFFRREIWRHVRQGHRRMTQKSVPAAGPPVLHRCSVCGITDLADPQMEFRYCTKCVGVPGYCLQHINAHEHRTATGG